MKPHHKSICFISHKAYPLLVKGGGGGPGGAERQLVLFGRELAASGWEVSFVTEPPQNPSRDLKPDLPVFFGRFTYLGKSNLTILVDWLLTIHAVHRSRSAFCVIKLPSHLLAPLSIYSRLFKRKLVFWAQIHDDAKPENRPLGKLASSLSIWGLKHTDIVIAQTFQQQYAFKKNYTIEAHLVRSICTQLSNECSSGRDRQVDVLWAANSSQNKRYEVVLELSKLLPQVTFAVAMNDVDSSRYQWARAALQECHNVRFLGMVPPQEMEKWFENAKVFLNTSELEGFPNTFLQAWMNGLPVVTLGVDPDGIIRSQNLGRTIDKEEVATCHKDFHRMARLLVAPITELLNNDHLSKTIGNNSKAYIARHHSPDIVLPALIAALHD